MHRTVPCVGRLRTGTAIARTVAMRLPRPHAPRFRRGPNRRPTASAATAFRDSVAPDVPASREPDDEHAPAEAPGAGFRASSYELKRGLDVVELPTSLPADVLDRLFKSPQR